MEIDLYYTMRSPYCYLATPGLNALVTNYSLNVNLKPVYPLAVSDATFFERVNPLWPPYVARDTQRIAQRLGIPFHWPRPDPIVQNSKTRQVADEQPYIYRLTRLAQVAANRGLGLEYVTQVSGLLYNPEVDGWNTGEHLAQSLATINLDLAELDSIVASSESELDAQITQNRADQLASGHWGAPLFVHESEIFFGQDRLADLEWHLKQRGMQTRA